MAPTQMSSKSLASFPPAQENARKPTKKKRTTNFTRTGQQFCHACVVGSVCVCWVCVCGPNEKSQNIKNVPATTATTQICTKITRIT